MRADTATVRYADTAQYWQNARGTGIRRVLDGLDAGQAAPVTDALEERVRPHRRADGIHLDATALLAVAER